MTCPVCGASSSAFLPHGVPSRPGRCPDCGAKARHRALALLARARLAPRLGPGSEVLEIGPSKVAVERLSGIWTEAGARYTAVDARALSHHAALRPPHRAFTMDARALDFPDASFDLVLCGNVLSFVREDAAVLEEIRRALKPGGLAVLTVHRVEGPTLSAEEFRRRHPALADDAYLEENGTAWYYGDDYETRLEAAGLFAAEAEPAGARAEFGLKARSRLTAAARSRTALDDWLQGAAT